MGYNHTFKKSWFWLLLLLILTSCQKDDVKQDIVYHFSHEQVSHKMVEVIDIPEVIQFLKSKSNTDLNFSIQTGGIPGQQNRSGEPDLVISDLITEQILAVTNQTNLTNYTFLLRIDTAPYYEGEVSFFNLIVKETTANEGYYAYIQEYRMDENWYVSNGSILDMQTYTGKMIFYTLEGLYVAKVDFSNGQITGNEYRSPCPNDDPGGSDPGGGGSTSGPGSDPGGPGGDPGGGTGGGGIQVIVVGCTCATPPHQPGETCTCENPPYVIVVWGDEDNEVNELLRSPCDETPVDCFHPNGDPCPCNEDETGCEEENPNVGVVLEKPHPDCSILNQILEHQPTKSKIVDLQNDLNSPIEKGFNLYMNSSGDVLSSPTAPGEVDRFNYSTASNIFGGTHLHHDGVFPMFSLQDLNALYSFWINFENGTNDSSLMTHIMVSQYGVYAVKIENVSKLTNFYNLSTGDPDILDWLNRQLKEKYLELEDPETGELTGNSISFEKALLELFVSNYDAGVSLYKAKSDLSGWDRKALNSSGTSVTTFSCD